MLIGVIFLSCCCYCLEPFLVKRLRPGDVLYDPKRPEILTDIRVDRSPGTIFPDNSIMEMRGQHAGNSLNRSLGLVMVGSMARSLLESDKR